MNIQHEPDGGFERVDASGVLLRHMSVLLVE